MLQLLSSVMHSRYQRHTQAIFLVSKVSCLEILVTNPDDLFGDALVCGCLIFIVHLHCCHFEGLKTKLLVTTFWHAISKNVINRVF